LTAWVKRGQLCGGFSGASWAKTHALLPIVDDDGGGRYRVYFSARDERGRSRIGWAESDLRPGGVWRVSQAPSLDLGPLGGFSDSGVTNSCIVTHHGVKYLFYTGWSLGTTVPFYLNVGLAISEDEGRTFRPLSDAPLLDRSSVDPFLTASPWVMIDGGVWRMWYVSGASWIIDDGKPKHRYHIRYAESRDGLAWDRRGVVCIDFKSDDEYAIARPCVVRDSGTYRMWYAYRGDRYRIGYAESADGIVWRRMDNAAGIDVTPGNFDGDMIEYACVFDARGRRLMLYNGDGYGRTGIGVAELARA
jgi:hypothetical protein